MRARGFHAVSSRRDSVTAEHPLDSIVVGASLEPRADHKAAVLFVSAGGGKKKRKHDLNHRETFSHFICGFMLIFTTCLPFPSFCRFMESLRRESPMYYT